MPAFDAPALDSASFDEAFRDYPTILCASALPASNLAAAHTFRSTDFHGNAANRAAPFRIAAYNQFSSRLSASVVAIDYRGFGDSEGTPSEAGLIRDAKAAWDWLMESKRALGIPEDEARQNVMVAGQSLGTGVAVGLTKLLVEAGTPPKALYLMAPYMSIIRLLTSYAIGGAIPIFAPLRLVPHHLGECCSRCVDLSVCKLTSSLVHHQRSFSASCTRGLRTTRYFLPWSEARARRLKAVPIKLQPCYGSCRTSSSLTPTTTTSFRARMARVSSMA